MSQKTLKELEGSDLFLQGNVEAEALFGEEKHPLVEGIVEVLRQIHPEVGISRSGALYLETLLLDLLARVLEAVVSDKSRRGEALTFEEVEKAVRSTLKGELADHAVKEMTKAVKQLSERLADAIILSPTSESSNTSLAKFHSISEKVMYALVYDRTVPEGLVIAFSALMDYLCAEIIELSGNAASTGALSCVVPTHIDFTITNDVELGSLFPKVSNKSLNPILFESEPDELAFLCTGELLWGQLSTILFGARQTLLDSSLRPPPSVSNGTIFERQFRYRVSARPGKWLVSRVKAPNQPLTVGYLLRHESLDRSDTLRRVTDLFEGNGSDKKKELFVGRYDWSWNFTQKNAKATTRRVYGEGSDADSNLIKSIVSLSSASCVLVNSESVESYLDFARGVGRIGDRALRIPGQNGEAVGIAMGQPKNVEGWDEAWMIFGPKTGGEAEADKELVALAYDPSYTSFGTVL